MNQEATKPKKKRGPNRIRNIGAFADSGGPVSVIFIIKDSKLCFRKKGSRKINEISLREIYDHVTGQLLMPFV